MADSEIPSGEGHTAESTPVPESPGGRGRLAKLIALGVLVVALVVAGIWFARYRSYGRFQQSTNDAYVQADGVTIAPKVSGYVDRVFVGDNEQVRVGQPLIQIDARDYRAQSAQSEAQIEVARAAAAGVAAQIGEQRAAVARAEADLAAARADAAFAQSEVARYAPLAESGAEPRERLSQLRNQAAQARAKVAAAQASLASASRRIGSLQAQVRQAQAQAQGARAQLAAADVNAGATLLRTPIAGRIGDRTVRQGQFVPAATRLMTIVPVDKLYVEANFKETQLGLMRPGQPVVVKVDALPGIEIPGRVDSIAPGTGAQFSLLPPQNATGNFTKIVQRIPVRIAISPGPEARAALVPGMSVEVEVDTRGAKGAGERLRTDQRQHDERTAR